VPPRQTAVRTALRRPASQAATLPTAAPASHTRMLAAVIAGAVAVLGAGGFFLYREVAKLAATAHAAAPAKPDRAVVTIASDPAGARVSATWAGGQQSGTAPLRIEVPLMTAIRYEVAKPGFATKSGDVVAETALAKVDVELTAVPAAAPPVAATSPSAPEQQKPAVVKKQTHSKKKSRQDDIDEGGVVDVFKDLSR
jgi:hypothetical protein